MGDYGDVLLGVGDAYVGDAILKIRLAVVVVTQIHLLLENLVEQGAHRKFLLAERFAAYERYFLHLVGRDGAHFDEFLLGLGYLPDRNFSFVFEFLS